MSGVLSYNGTFLVLMMVYSIGGRECFLLHTAFVNTVFWLNIDKGTGVWKLHRETCRFCNPKETQLKGVNRMRRNGGWIRVDSFTSAHNMYLDSREHQEYWQPCKECTPK